MGLTSSPHRTPLLLWSLLLSLTFVRSATLSSSSTTLSSVTTPTPSSNSSSPSPSFSYAATPTKGFAYFPQPMIELKLNKDRQIGFGKSSAFDDVRSFSVVSQDGATLPSYDTVYYFSQLIDHSRPELGTFQQRYYFTYEFYQPGGPIFFNTPSESNLEKFDAAITNSSINGYLAQANKGAALVLEHRFFGRSNPYPSLSEANLATLTVNQTIEDIVYFATHVELPMPGGKGLGPTNAPWVLVGGSYAGSLVAWTMNRYPGVFAAGWASSAVLHSLNYHWVYFDIIRQNTPANCSNDIEAVVSHLDQVFTNGTAAEQSQIKASFGLSALQYADEFMSAIRAPLWTFQDFQPTYEDPNAGYHAFCNYLEFDRTNQVFETKGTGFGLDHALIKYANWTRFEIKQAGCLGNEHACYATHDNEDSVWSNTQLGLNLRSWAWLYCNEFGWFFSGAPEAWPSLTSRLTNPDTEMRSCSLYFPQTFPQGTIANTVLNNTAFNIMYKGWNIRTDNVFFVNGAKDPWRGVTLSSDLHFRNSSRRQPIAVAQGGFHCSDQMIAQGVANPSVKAAQDLGTSYIYLWLSQWYDWNPHVKRPASVVEWADPDDLPHPTITITSIPKYVIDSPPFGNARSANATGFGEGNPPVKVDRPRSSGLSRYQHLASVLHMAATLILPLSITTVLPSLGLPPLVF